MPILHMTKLFERRGRLAVVVALVLAGTMAPAAARAQLLSDDVPRERTLPEKQQIEADMARSRLRFGPLRVLPGFSITNAGYDNNVFGTQTDPFADWLFSINAGARFLVPFGSKVYLRADAFPQYTWYDKLSQRRGFGGNYGADLFGFFNRLTVQMGAVGSEAYAIYSSELNTRVLSKNIAGSGRFELALTHAVSLFGGGDASRVRYTDPEGLPEQQVSVRINDRTDTRARGGVRYKFSNSCDVGALVEETWSEFESTPGARDNRSTGYLVSFHYDRPQFYVDLTGGYRQGRADNDSIFPDYSTGTGSAFVSYYPIRWLEIQAYGRRRVAYSVSVGSPYYFESRLGGGVNVQVIPRLNLKAFAEVGPNNYPTPSVVDGVEIKRRDQVRTYGGGLSLGLVRQAVLSGQVERFVYTSNGPGVVGAYTRFTMGISLGGEFSR